MREGTMNNHWNWLSPRACHDSCVVFPEDRHGSAWSKTSGHHDPWGAFSPPVFYLHVVASHYILRPLYNPWRPWKYFIMGGIVRVSWHGFMVCPLLPHFFSCAQRARKPVYVLSAWFALSIYIYIMTYVFPLLRDSRMNSLLLHNWVFVIYTWGKIFCAVRALYVQYQRRGAGRTTPALATWQ